MANRGVLEGVLVEHLCVQQWALQRDYHNKFGEENGDVKSY